MSALAALAEVETGSDDGRANVRLWLRLLACTSAAEKMLQRRLAAEFGSTLPRFDLLAALDRRGDGMTMGELSRALLVSGGNVTAIVRALDRDGYVRIERNPRDRRSALVRLSAAGEHHFAAMAHAHRGWVDRLFVGLDDDARDTLFDALKGLKTSIEASKCGETA